MAFGRKKYFFCQKGFLLIELILAFALLVSMSTVLMMCMVRAVYDQRLYVQKQQALLYAHNALASWVAHDQDKQEVPYPFNLTLQEIKEGNYFSFEIGRAHV